MVDLCNDFLVMPVLPTWPIFQKVGYTEIFIYQYLSTISRKFSAQEFVRQYDLKNDVEEIQAFTKEEFSGPTIVISGPFNSGLHVLCNLFDFRLFIFFSFHSVFIDFVIQSTNDFLKKK